jgi:hypothetical protein
MWQSVFLCRCDGGMRNQILVVAVSALVLSGCPAGGFFGRYVIVNNTGSTIANLKISVGNGREQTWDQTLAGQGWIHLKPLGRKSLIVSWSDETGDHEECFSFEKKTSYRSRADLYIELKPQGHLAWRVIEPPTEDGGPATILALVGAYLFYCLGVGLLVGVPLALAAVITYYLFKGARAGLTGIVQGLRGDRTVFQFTIREIVLLTTVIALALGWSVHFLASIRH